MIILTCSTATMMFAKSRDSFTTNHISYAENFMRERRLIAAHINVVHPKINRWLNTQYFADSPVRLCLLFWLFTSVVAVCYCCFTININILFYKYIKMIVVNNLSYFRFSCCCLYCCMSAHLHWSVDSGVVTKKIYVQLMTMKYLSIK